MGPTFSTEINPAAVSQAQVALDADALFGALNMLPVPAWTATHEGDVEFINNALCAFAGRSRDELLRSGWWKMVVEEDREETQIAWSAAISSGEPYSHCHRYRNADGAPIRFLVRAVPLRDGSGAIVRWVGTSADIEGVHCALTSIIEHNERYRVMVESVADLVLTTDAEGQILGDCPALEQFTGLTRQEYQLFGWMNAIHPRDRGAATEAWTAAIATPSGRAVPVRVRRAGGEDRYSRVLVRAVPIRDHTGQLNEWFVSVSAIDESLVAAMSVLPQPS